MERGRSQLTKDHTLATAYARLLPTVGAGDPARLNLANPDSDGPLVPIIRVDGATMPAQDGNDFPIFFFVLQCFPAGFKKQK